MPVNSSRQAHRLSIDSDNPLGGRETYGGTSFGYTVTQLDLMPLAGHSVRFRFRMGTDESRGDSIWFIDDVHIYQCRSIVISR
jgi:hypothetical protein